MWNSLVYFGSSRPVLIQFIPGILYVSNNQLNFKTPVSGLHTHNKRHRTQICTLFTYHLLTFYEQRDKYHPHLFAIAVEPIFPTNASVLLFIATKNHTYVLIITSWVFMIIVLLFDTDFPFFYFHNFFFGKIEFIVIAICI